MTLVNLFKISTKVLKVPDGPEDKSIVSHAISSAYAS